MVNDGKTNQQNEETRARTLPRNVIIKELEAITKRRGRECTEGKEGKTPESRVRNIIDEIKDPACGEENKTQNITPKVGWGLTGLALSGGGIRSATFSLGVLQALAHHDLLRYIDYLSTVSGGGYIGASLHHFLSEAMKTECQKLPPEQQKPGVEPKNLPFGTGPKNLPFGTSEPGPESRRSPQARQEYQLLKYLRTHGNYLTPGNGITLMSGIAVVLRGALTSLAIWVPIITLIMTILMFVYPNFFSFLIYFSIFVVGIYLLSCSVYSLSPLVLSKRDAQLRYGWRRLFEKHTGIILCIPIVSLSLSLLPIIHELLPQWGGIFGILSSLVVGMRTFVQSRKANRNNKELTVLAPIGAALFLYGVLLLSYSSARFFVEGTFSLFATGNFSLGWEFLRSWEFLGIAALVAIVSGFCVDLNHMSLHRFYRDRLMEAFMPDLDAVVNDRSAPAPPPASVASAARLSEIESPLCPYHLINANVVLVDAKDRRARMRGGDNFVLSHDYSGSTFTGWKLTKELGKDITLATAMAVSGAAVNPHTGIGGRGLTTSRLVSLFMGLLNMRLGGWMENPMSSERRDEIHNQRRQKLVRLWRWRRLWLWRWLWRLRRRLRRLWRWRWLWRRRWRRLWRWRWRRLWRWLWRLRRLWRQLSRPKPNHFRAFWYEIVRQGAYDGTSRLIHLSDGGHFENLGLYELVRRQLKLIIVCDGSADPEYAFRSLDLALNRISEDFGVWIDFENGEHLRAMLPCAQESVQQGVFPAEKGYAVGLIHYPNRTERGLLIYLKSTLIKECTLELLCYGRNNPSFPHETTVDQFFSEAQFEAYRELGYLIAKQLIGDEAVGLLRTMDEIVNPDSENSNAAWPDPEYSI